MIAYYNPNFDLTSLIKAIFTSNSEKRIIKFFQNHTRKKYILVTNSCRSALYLAYRAIPAKGEVITNPLTCQVALLPIVFSGNRVVYTDITENTLTMQTENLVRLINKETIAIQAIHQGGFLCNMAEIKKAIGQKKIYLIEDCAQGLFSAYDKQQPGNYSDIVCFSLIKNAYGIGGGILATDDLFIFKKACEIQKEFNKPSKLLMGFRIVRNLLETKRKSRLFDFLYRKLMQNRFEGKDQTKNSGFYLKIAQPSKIEIKIACEQIQKAAQLNEIRKKKGLLLLEKLKNAGLITNYSDINSYDSAFTKFFLVNPSIKSNAFIPKLTLMGVEAKHLEHKYKHDYQPRIDHCHFTDLISNIESCPNYLRLYDNLISLPLKEDMEEKTMDDMVLILQNLLKHE